MLPGTREDAPPSTSGPAAVAPTDRTAKARSASVARRSEIIAAAIRVIARDGIRACTVSALESETGFARGHFTYHFSSKEEIITLAFAAVGSDWATFQVEQAQGPTARARLETQIRAAATWGRQRPEYFRCLMNFRVEMMRDPGAFPRAPGIRARLLEAAAMTIRQAMDEGDFRPDLDPPWEARILFAVVDGFLMHATMDVAFCPPDELADRAWRVVSERLLHTPAPD
ncbi:MAG: TetR family transcriptional regulator [Deltaproteobacteria bacterium]|nr:TetR family transcriptional regulator [Deltaproteobacteria bacterium]